MVTSALLQCGIQPENMWFIWKTNISHGEYPPHPTFGHSLKGYGKLEMNHFIQLSEKNFESHQVPHREETNGR